MGDINTAVNTPTVLAGVGDHNYVGGDVHADNYQSVGSEHIGDEYFSGGGDINTAVNAPTVLAGIGDHNYIGGDVHADSLQFVGSEHFGF